MIEQIATMLHQRARHRLWLISDLQQSIPENATLCMRVAAEDFAALSLPCQYIFYLGDAVEGHDRVYIEEMTQMQFEKLDPLGIPVVYVVGNHDFDYYRHHRQELSRVELPFYDAVKGHALWRTGALEDFYFALDMGEYAVVCLPDHAAADGSWFTTHGEIHGDVSAYPYGEDDWKALSERIKKWQKPVFTMGHYSFLGGNREAPLQSRMLPLPDNVRIHFYGHAHIGDAVWAGKDCYRKLSAVDWQDIVQINVASLENFRGSAIRSAFLEIYEDGTYGVLFRNHTQKKWEEAYLVDTKPVSQKTVGGNLSLSES